MLAAALLHSPQVLFLDELFEDIDPIRGKPRRRVKFYHEDLASERGNLLKAQDLVAGYLVDLPRIADQ